MHKSDIDGENTGADANQADVLSRSAACRTSVIPFRRAKSAASSGSAAAGDPRQDPAAFIPLGSAVAAVVIRLQSARPSIRVLASTSAGEEDEGRDQS